MNERRELPHLPLSSEDAEAVEECLLDEKALSITQLRQISVVKEVAKRRRRLGVDLWKEVTRRAHRATKI